MHKDNAVWGSKFSLLFGSVNVIHLNEKWTIESFGYRMSSPPVDSVPLNAQVAWWNRESLISIKTRKGIFFLKSVGSPRVVHLLACVSLKRLSVSPRILQRPGFAHGACHSAQQHGTSGPVLSAGPALAAEQHPPLIGTLPMSWIVLSSPQTAPCVWTLCYWSPSHNISQTAVNISSASNNVLFPGHVCWYVCVGVEESACVCVRYTALENTFSLSSVCNPELGKVSRGFWLENIHLHTHMHTKSHTHFLFQSWTMTSRTFNQNLMG